MDTTGQRLARKLSELSMSQRALSEAVGVSQPSVHDWVNDKTYPRRKHQARIAKALGVQASELFPYPDDADVDAVVAS